MNKKINFLLVIALIAVFVGPQIALGDLNTNTTGAFAPQSLTLQNTATTNTSPSSPTCTTPTNMVMLFDYGSCLLSNVVIRFIIGLGVVMFLVGVLQYVTAGDNEEKREGGRNMMIFGIIALFVMVSVWGFVKLLSSSFGFDYNLPTLPPAGK